MPRPVESSASRQVLCAGCGNALGVKGSRPAEKVPYDRKLLVHRDQVCRGQALRKYIEARNGVAESIANGGNQ